MTHLNMNVAYSIWFIIRCNTFCLSVCPPVGPLVVRVNFHKSYAIEGSWHWSWLGNATAPKVLASTALSMAATESALNWHCKKKSPTYSNHLATLPHFEYFFFPCLNVAINCVKLAASDYERHQLNSRVQRNWEMLQCCNVAVWQSAS